MNPCEMERHLKSMGYRLMDSKKGKWGKPVGNGIFLFEMKDLYLSYIFRSIPGELQTWDKLKVDDERFLASLKSAENGCFHAMWECPSEFQFLNAEEIMEL